MKKNTDNVLSFRQPPEFYIKKAEKHIEQGNFLEALQLYRKLIGMEPDNAQYLLYIAQIYSEIGLYEESNDIIHKIMRQGEAPTECLFALGCNYLGLNKHEIADNYFYEYLKKDPEGEFADEIDDIWDIYYDDPDEEPFVVIKDESAEQNAEKGKEYLDKREYKKAIAYLEIAVKQSPGLLYAANNLALCYYFDGNLDAAVTISMNILAQNSANIHAHCNLAMIYYKTCDSKLNIHLKAIENAKITEPQDMHKIALMYCEINYHEKAYKWFQSLLPFQPYDVRILHFCGLSAYNYGLYSKAHDCFLKILMIDPSNSIAAYYKRITQISKNTGSGKTLEYVYQVPFDEIKRRMKYLREILKESDRTLKEMWNTDDQFASVLLWGLRYGDDYIKRIALEIISVFSDKRAEEIFRDFILRISETDELKNEVFLYLNNMGAQEPFIALIKGEFAEVRIDTATSKINELANKYIDTLNIFMHSGINRYDEKTITAGVELFVTFAAEKSEGAGWIKRPQALAAALEIITCEKLGIETAISKTQLAKIYGTTVVSINKYYEIFAETLKIGGDKND